MKNKRAVLYSPRLSELRRKRRNIFFLKTVFFILIFAFFIGGLAFVSKIRKLNINDIVVTGNKIVDSEAIKEVAQADLSGEYLWLFPKTNLVLYPKTKIQNDLYARFGRLKDISLGLNGRIIQITVSERTGLYTWCGSAPGAEKSQIEKCNFVDENGYIFDEAPYFSGDVYFKLYGEPFKNNYPVFNDLINFKKNLEMMGIKPVALYVKEDANAVIFLSATSSKAPEIIFKTDTDFAEMLENLQTALTTEPLQTDFKKKYTSLEYIDLRFGNKVYYKFK